LYLVVKHTAGSRGKRQVLGVSVEEVVCAEISQDRCRRLAVATQDVDQSIRQLGELRRTVDTQRAVMGVDAATQSTHDGMQTRPRTAKNTYKTTPTCRQPLTCDSYAAFHSSRELVFTRSRDPGNHEFTTCQWNAF